MASLLQLPQELLDMILELLDDFSLEDLPSNHLQQAAKKHLFRSITLDEAEIFNLEQKINEDKNLVNYVRNVTIVTDSSLDEKNYQSIQAIINALPQPPVCQKVTVKCPEGAILANIPESLKISILRLTKGNYFQTLELEDGRFPHVGMAFDDDIKDMDFFENWEPIWHISPHPLDKNRKMAYIKSLSLYGISREEYDSLAVLGDEEKTMASLKNLRSLTIRPNFLYDYKLLNSVLKRCGDSIEDFGLGIGTSQIQVAYALLRIYFNKG
ncbi:hypothetical protein H0H81_002973 [Sphagnurus paluster]|uniref:Uncharacterized protein n=1 Tax=Sphagnurus paluster TaxID=117069 RepID=A0A9P7KIC2_9AGAR|nr:hypothetical protein H0H81_002973 [Sphagnurus paluster]